MGCLNAGQGFDHWFGNIHLSGPCNRSCYFCIGQWMPGQDDQNNLHTIDLKGYDWFVEECRERGITEVNVTGSNTDPLMHADLPGLCVRLKESGFTRIGVRTNGVLLEKMASLLWFIDKISISVTSLDPELYRETMGSGNPPDVARIKSLCDDRGVDLKANVVLCPETVDTLDVYKTVRGLSKAGFRKINLREPYGQRHVGDPMKKIGFTRSGEVHGMPRYDVLIETNGDGETTEVVYWDVHYVEVESVNLYADGHVSVLYPVSLGHSETLGDVRPQDTFDQGRQRAQWGGRIAP